MGIIIAKFKKKKSTYEILEKLENHITSIEEFQKNTQQTKRKIVFRFLILATITYVLLAFFLYMYYSSHVSNSQKVLCITVVITFPIIIWIIKKILTWYYCRKIKKNETKLKSLKEEKKRILDNVMETETYKVAKKILDQFGNKEPPKLLTNVEVTPAVNKSSLVPATSARTIQNDNQSVLRQRVAAQTAMRGRVSFGGAPSPEPPGRFSIGPGFSTAVTPASSKRLALVPAGATPAGLAYTPALPRPVLPRDRSALDKMMDYLVGDGPSNRYALVCRECQSHNGMALKEEFEYLSFRCCYCSAFNPSRKQRPTAPKFELKAKEKSSPETSDTDTDVDTPKTTITELKDTFDDLKSSQSEKSASSDIEKILGSEKPQSPEIGTNASPNVEEVADSDKSSDIELIPESSAMDIDLGDSLNAEITAETQPDNTVTNKQESE